MDEHGSGSQQSGEPGGPPVSHGHARWPGDPVGGEASGGYFMDPGVPAPPGTYQAGAGYLPGQRPPGRRPPGIVSYVAVAAVAACCGGLAVAAFVPGSGGPSGSGSLAPVRSGGSSAFPGNGTGTGPGAGTNPGAGISGAATQRVEDAVRPGIVVIDSRLQDDGNITGEIGRASCRERV